MHLHQALKQDDSAEFIKVVVKEVNDHTEQKHCKFIEQNKVPEGVMPIPLVWAMRIKHNLTTNESTNKTSSISMAGSRNLESTL